VTKSKRFKKAPRDDLLGMAVDCQNELHPRWRQFLTIHEQPWLEHHIITNTVLFPGAGMLIMALEAARQIADTTRRVKGFEFRDVASDRGLVIPHDQDQAVETSLEFQPHKLNNKIVKGWTRFTLFSLSLGDDERWIEHCSGLISTAYEDLDDIDAGAEEHQQWLDHSETFHHIRTTCQQAIDKSAFYENLTKVGMGYEQLFQNLGDAYGGPSCGYGTVTIPDTKATMPFEYEYPHLIHPATLDAIFHLLFVGLESGANMTDAAVPISMGSMFIAAELPQAVGSIFQGYNVGKMTTTREGSWSIVVSDTQWSSPKIIIHDFVACKVSGKAEEAELGLEQLCTQIQWIEDVDLARGSASEDVLATASTPALQSQLFAWLDRLCRKRSDLNVLIIQSRDAPLYIQILQRFAPLIGGRGRFDLCTVVGISEDVTSEARKISDDESWICNWKIASLTDLVGQQMTDQTSFDLIIATQLDQCDPRYSLTASYWGLDGPE
jgi:acyl transferase domain-containing protein